MKTIQTLLTASLAALLLLVAPGQAPAQENAAATLDELLRNVRESGATTNVVNQQREQEFRQRRDQQEAILRRTQAEVRQEEDRSNRLKEQFDTNERDLEELSEALRIRIGDMGELFGIVRQVAGDTKGVVDSSLISAQISGRHDVSSRLAQSTELPSISDLRELQAILLEEMIESGKVVRFSTEIEDAAGLKQSSSVVRVGSFNVVNDEGYLTYDVDTNTLRELARQPAARYQKSAVNLFDAPSGYTGFSIDPSRGSLLALVIRSPSVFEQISFGGPIGYVIIFLAIAGIGVALYRFIVLQMIGSRVRRQMNSDEPNSNNPLGRVLAVYEANKSMPVETLDLKLDEAILRETPRLESLQGLIKVLAGIAPLMGLLGTVVGMIRTFQSITLFGTGDPKLMADGISQALITTVEGLIAAIPLVFLHALLTAKSRNVIDILEAQSAGMIARHAERSLRPE